MTFIKRRPRALQCNSAMNIPQSDRERAARALAAIADLKQALQEAHFAARELEELIHAPREDRPSDRIHALRVAAGRLAADIEAAFAAYQEVDLRRVELRSAGLPSAEAAT